ncbi:MAG: family 78 glycoside hydrolase catalytic domain [Candidatus Fimimonas sp.]
MNGKFLGIKESNDTFTVEKTFVLSSVKKATLRATALGLYFAEINGRRVGDQKMTPGWTSYFTTLQYQEYDVTNLLSVGENTLSVTVSGGWFCSGLGFNSAAPRLKYGEKPAVLAELDLTDVVIATDCDWTAKESFIKSSGIYDGEIQDFSRPLSRLTVTEVPWDKSVLVKQQCEPVRDIEKIAVKNIIVTPKGELVYDFGQNVTGVAQIETDEDFDGTITLAFSEILVDGNFFDKGTRTAKATDSFTLQGRKTLCPEFTFHGFRYMKMTGANIPAQKVFAVVRHTDLKRTGFIRTSNELVQKLVNNVVWSQRDNYLDIPTDCPQRDERMGWTGDANVFLETACYNYDVRKFFKKWLRDLRNDQAETGEVPHVVPDILGWKNTATVWCDSVAMIPWTLYKFYGDETFLTENYSAMKKYLVAVEKTMKNGVVAEGQQYGDWLAMDNERFADDGCHGRTDSYFIATVFYAECLKITGYTAELTGESGFAKECKEKYNVTIRRMREEYFSASGRFVFDTVTAQVLAVYCNIYLWTLLKSIEKCMNRNLVYTFSFIF